MAKPKLSLVANPTFKAKVAIPVPGDKAVDVEFTFKGRNREAFKTYIASMDGREDVDLIMDAASGWDLEDAFDRDNVEKLTQNYMGSARAIFDKYVGELTQARLGN